MIDNIGLKLEAVDMTSYNRIIGNTGAERPRDSSRMYTKWNNVLLTYYPNEERLIIKNSFHKLYNALFCNELINHNNFHLSQLNELSDLLSTVYFKRPKEDFILTGKFEFGLNINTDNLNPYSICERWLSHKNEFNIINPNKGKPLQKTCYFSDYRIKVYNKSKQSDVKDKNILRYEIAVDKIRKVKSILGKNNITLKDLNEHETWVKLYYYLLSTYDNIKKLPFLSEPIPKQDIMEIHAYCNKLMADDIRQHMNKSSYNKLRATYKKVYEKYDQHSSNIHLLIREKLEMNFIDICN